MMELDRHHDGGGWARFKMARALLMSFSRLPSGPAVRGTGALSLFGVSATMRHRKLVKLPQSLS